MNQTLHISNRVCRKVRLHKGTDSQQTVHVHWFSSGFAYYSLSSILITQFKEPSIGLQLATELGTIALLSNIIREMMPLVGAPLIRKYFGQLAPISAAGVNSMDVLLPSITRCSGKEVMPIAIFHGILIDLSVPFFVNLFCNL